MKKIKLIILTCFLINTLYSANYKGIDISHHQGKIVWSKIDTNIKFTIIKATEGLDFKDKYFDYNWKEIKNTNIYRGAYHYFRPNKSGIEQAKFFLKTVGFKKGDIIPVIDIEKMNYKITYIYKKRGKKTIKLKRIKVQNLIAYQNLKDMIDYIYEVLHVKPILYTSTCHWKSYYDKFFENEHHHILWIADYRKNVINPNIPKCWNDWTIWQYSPKYKIKGLNKYVDINISKKHPNEFIIK